MAKKKTKSKSNNNTGSGALTLLTLITSAFAFICFGLFLAASLAQDMGMECYLLGGAGTLISALSLLFIFRYHVGLKRFICFCMTVFTLTFSLFVLITTVYPENLPQDDKFTVIVFGAHTNGYMPGRTLITRLNRAKLLLDENPQAVCIVSGAQGDNETVAEAAAMEKFLTERGIAPERIICEYEAHDTISNLKYSEELILSNGLEDDPIVIVSSAYHLPRIRFAASHYVGGIYSERELYTAGSYSTAVYYFISDNLREYMAWVKLLGRIGIEKLGGLIEAKTTG